MAGRASKRVTRRQASRRSSTETDGLPTGERVFRHLQRMIIDGEMGPGTRLVELSLAEQFGVSRTPVREALRRLVHNHLLLTDPIRGLVVSAPEAAEVDEVYLVREVLDGLAWRLATEKVTPEDLARLRMINEAMREAIREGRVELVVKASDAFHDLIYRIAGNRTLTRYGMELRNFVRRLSGERFASPPRVDAILRDHERLVDAMERDDAAAAERASTEHLRTARAFIAQFHIRRDVGASVDGSS